MTSPRWREFLKLTAVPGYPGIHVLGSFAQRVTVYSQQVRALNLIDALCKTGRLSPDSDLAVIGGGAAGLTAAAGAAVRGVKVKLLEKSSRVMTLQSDAVHRWLHPHIYDWPNNQVSNRAQLPQLDWEAGKANHVVSQLRAQWDQLRATHQTLDERCSASNLEIHPDNGKVAVTWSDRKGPHVFSFDVVILAVGFGVEPEGPGKFSYWVKDDLDGQVYGPRKCLVSGYGDGGLTDLMRLCISCFSHEKIVGLFANDPAIETVRQELLEIENHPEAGDRRFLSQKYDHLTVDHLIKELNQVQRDNKVFFNGASPFLYGPESSILNRFIVSQLAKTNNSFILKPGKIKKVEALGEKKGCVVEFGNGDREEYDIVSCRHGPDPVLKTEPKDGDKTEFREIGKACNDLRQSWRELPPSQDWTRQPMWSTEAFLPGEADAFSVPQPIVLSSPEEKKLKCLILVSGVSKESKRLQDTVEHALLRNRRDIETGSPLALNLSPQLIDVNQVLKKTELYDQTVRDLCAAEIAVFDISGIETGSEPGMLLFLGIRSVVRRGVTVTTVRERLDDAVWSQLPFNLKELNPVSYGDDPGHDHPRHPVNRIGEMLKEGLSLLRDLPQNYLDLPAFDAVRRLGSTPENYRSIPLEKQILVLCPFSPAYTEENWKNYLVRQVPTTFKEKVETELGIKAEIALIRITDIASPRLVSQRLYAEIRRSDLCLVDWTEWRANVFYEMGVRLAVNQIAPVCVVCRDGLATAGQRGDLLRLFAPITYSTQAPSSDEFRQALLERYDEVKLLSPVNNRNGALAHDHTFNIIRNAIHQQQESGGAEVYSELSTAAYAMINKDDLAAGAWPILYWQNSELTRQARRGAIERLLAAWYYLQERHQAATLPSHDPRWRDYVRLGKKLKPLLLDTGNEQDEKLGRAIGKKVSALEKRAKKQAKLGGGAA